jgi:hypothetical protein
LTELAAAIRDIPMPPSIAALPVEARGFPVPWFAEVGADGVPDLRMIGAGKLVKAVRLQRCWVCGGPLGRLKVSVIGPMCAVNRVSAEPPCHLQCARYAVRACPFLTQPRMRRNARDLPEERFAPGVMIERNPGVTCLWSSLRKSKPVDVSGMPVGNGGVLFQLGPPEHVEWWARGRPATRQECQDAIESGLPGLREIAELEGNGAIEDLARATLRAVARLPAEVGA